MYIIKNKRKLLKREKKSMSEYQLHTIYFVLTVCVLQKMQGSYGNLLTGWYNRLRLGLDLDLFRS